MSDSDDRQDTHMTDATEQTPGHSQEISAQGIGLQLQPFWPNNVRLWFVSTEVQFSLLKITSDSTKFGQTLLKLPPDMLELVLDIANKPPAQNKYETLKEALITRNSPSEERQLEQLLDRTAIGDLKPSGVLRQIRNLAGDNFNPRIQKSLWLRKLPEYIQIALLSQEEFKTSDELARIGDKLHECYNKSHDVHAVTRQSRPRDKVRFDSNIPSTSQSASTSSNNNDSQSIEARLARIEHTLSKMGRQYTPRIEHALSRTRSTTPNRSYGASRTPYLRRRSQSRSRNRFDRQPVNDNPEYCWYHQMFDGNAGRCRAPCTHPNAMQQINKITTNKLVSFQKSNSPN